MHGPGPGATPPPPGRRPAVATLVALRGLLVVLSIGSLGMLSWAAMLRIAIIRRRPLDWFLFWAVLVLAIVSFGVIAEFSEESGAAGAAGGQQEPETATGIDLVLLLLLVAMALGVPVHYLVAEIRHYQQPEARWEAAPAHPSPYGPPADGKPAPPGYGYPPVSQPPAPGYGYPPPQTTPSYPASPQHPPSYDTPVRNLPPRTTPPPAPSPYTAPPPHPAYTQQPQPQPPHHRPDPVTPVTPDPGKPRIDQVRAELDELSDYLRKEQGR